jgi:hypothetical protein
MPSPLSNNGPEDSHEIDQRLVELFDQIPYLDSEELGFYVANDLTLPESAGGGWGRLYLKNVEGEGVSIEIGEDLVKVKYLVSVSDSRGNFAVFYFSADGECCKFNQQGMPAFVLPELENLIEGQRSDFSLPGDTLPPAGMKWEDYE